MLDTAEDMTSQGATEVGLLKEMTNLLVDVHAPLKHGFWKNLSGKEWRRHLSKTYSAVSDPSSGQPTQQDKNL